MADSDFDWRQADLPGVARRCQQQAFVVKLTCSGLKGHALPCRRNNIGRIRRKPPDPMRFVEVFHLFCSVTKISRFASAAGRRSVAPEGQRISIQSARGAAPKPKCRRLSLFER